MLYRERYMLKPYFSTKITNIYDKEYIEEIFEKETLLYEYNTECIDYVSIDESRKKKLKCNLREYDVIQYEIYNIGMGPAINVSLMIENGLVFSNQSVAKADVMIVYFFVDKTCIDKKQEFDFRLRYMDLLEQNEYEQIEVKKVVDIEMEYNVWKEDRKRINSYKLVNYKTTPRKLIVDMKRTSELERICNMLQSNYTGDNITKYEFAYNRLKTHVGEDRNKVLNLKAELIQNDYGKNRDSLFAILAFIISFSTFIVTIFSREYRIKIETLMALLALILIMVFCYWGYCILRRFRNVSRWGAYIEVALDELDKK